MRHACNPWEEIGVELFAEGGVGCGLLMSPQPPDAKAAYKN